MRPTITTAEYQELERHEHAGRNAAGAWALGRSARYGTVLVPVDVEPGSTIRVDLCGIIGTEAEASESTLGDRR